tara:strand:- start:599 stop:1237 length:639 start_codon:yes stop_codon:yes gene_type:complete
MKKVFWIIGLCLLINNCATPVGQQSNSDDSYSFYAKTEMRPILKGAKGVAKDMATFYSLGLYSPQYYDFYEYADTKGEAKDKSIAACDKMLLEKKWQKLATCTFRNTYLTSKGEKEKPKQERALELASLVEQAKNNCKSLGFEEGTEKFTDCSLKLYTQSVELAAKENEKIVQSQSSGTNKTTIYDPARESRVLINKGQRMISGACTLGIDC